MQFEPSYYASDGFCFCPCGGRLPEGAKRMDAPFSPLIFLVDRPSAESRGFYAIHFGAELAEEEGPGLLLPCAALEGSPLDTFVRENGAAVLNTAFSRCFTVLRDYFARKNRKKRMTLVGLGDVGGTVLTGLKLLGQELDEIGIYDPNEAQCARYELELNQVLPFSDGTLPRVTIRSSEALFDCDALLFTASRGVPGLDSGVADVRMAQYEANRGMLAAYARMARERCFTGLFAQISDPVDQLSRSVFLESNRGDDGKIDFQGLLPEQVQGFGLGVMRARARYYAEKHGLPVESVRAFGPHGSGLVIANAADGAYDQALSQRLTEEAITANLRVRELGFKPYIAPGLSSACISVLRALQGEWHDGAVPLGGVYFGCTTRFSALGPATLRAPLHPALFSHIQKSYAALKEFDGTCDH